MKREECHERVLRNLEKEYHLSGEVDALVEFTEDGPSHWEKYLDANTPRIVFLAKETHSSFHPSTPIKINGRFGINIGKWASALFNINRDIENKYIENLQEAYDTIAIVEVKKIDGETRAVDVDLRKFAWIGREFLKDQLEILEPHIVICCGTLEYFDIIFNYSAEERLLFEKEIYSNGDLRCWVSDNKLVVSFFHPSASKNSDEMLDEIKAFVTNDIVKQAYLDIISKARFIN